MIVARLIKLAGSRNGFAGLSQSRFFHILISVGIIFVTSYVSADPVAIGVFGKKSSGDFRSDSEWQWGLRGGGVQVLALDSLTKSLFDLSLVIIDDRSLDERDSERLDKWVAEGGVLIVAGARSLFGQRIDGNRSLPKAALNKILIELAGVKPEYHDPGVLGSYPRIVRNDPLISPFRKGDGLRLGEPGVAHALRLRAPDAEILAESSRLRPGKNGVVEHSSIPALTMRRFGEGLVLFSSFSLASVAGCYPDADGRATDCSGAGTARALMRILVANLLWEQHGLQVPLLWETPGNAATGVVITGDVHADQHQVQIRSARQMTSVFSSLDLPLTFFIVGDVAVQAPEHFQALNGHANVEVATHSAHGKKYHLGRSSVSGRRRGGIHGAAAVREDVREAERMLGLADWPRNRPWASAIRTEAWASNETESAAWTGMVEAGIGLVFDHNADSVLPQPQWSAPTTWFEGEIQQRLFVPMFDRSVTTAHDDFRLTSEMARKIASIGSPEPDPARNHAVTFEIYGDYVSRWHSAFRRIGVMGGITEVWLWHPSTPVRKGGLTELKSVLEDMASDPGVEFFHGNELATWYRNREQVRVQPRYDEASTLVELELNLAHADTLLPLPPDSASPTSTISYWVLGEVSVPGWDTRRWSDPAGRTISVLSRPLPVPGLEP